MAVKTVTLYTRQNDKTLRQLERDGRIINHRAYVEMHFRRHCAALYGELRLVYERGGKARAKA
jgi:hypothetical protein